MKHQNAIREYSLISLMAAGASIAAHAQTFVNQNVDAKSSIFEANPLNSTDGTSPPRFDLDPGTNRVLQFSSVTGLTYASSGVPSFTADGGFWFGFGTNVNSLGNISGWFGTDAVSNLALLGVFTNDTASGPLPPPQVSVSKTLLAYTPLLNQSFFIGDGIINSTGEVQSFLVPDGATRLFLGFADSFNFNGDPAAYFDNIGDLNVSFSVAAIPELGTLPMLAIGVAGLYLLRRNRSVA